jgi:hypothetical protein
MPAEKQATSISYSNASCEQHLIRYSARLHEPSFHSFEISKRHTVSYDIQALIAVGRTFFSSLLSNRRKRIVGSDQSNRAGKVRLPLSCLARDKQSRQCRYRGRSSQHGWGNNCDLVSYNGTSKARIKNKREGSQFYSALLVFSSHILSPSTSLHSTLRISLHLTNSTLALVDPHYYPNPSSPALDEYHSLFPIKS